MKRIAISILCVLHGLVLQAQETGPPYDSPRIQPDLHEENQAIAIYTETPLSIDGEYDEIWDRVHIIIDGALCFQFSRLVKSAQCKV